MNLVSVLHLGHILLGFQNLLNSEKGRLWSLRKPKTKRMRILKTVELEMNAVFIGSKLVTTTFLLFDIRVTGSLFTKSEISVKSAKPSSF